MKLPLRATTVVGPGGWTAKFTRSDALWAARMLEGEAGDKAWKTKEGEAILWTMMNYWYWMRDKALGRGEAHHKPPHTYTDIIRAYSQPINPFWLTPGEGDARSPDKIARRQRIQSMTWEQINPNTQAIVVAFMQGKISGAPYAGVVHFVAPGYERPELVKVSLPGVGTSSNVFFKLPQTTGWSGDMFRFKEGSPVMYAIPITLTVLTFGGMYLWQKRKSFGNTLKGHTAVTDEFIEKMGHEGKNSESYLNELSTSELDEIIERLKYDVARKRSRKVKISMLTDFFRAKRSFMIIAGVWDK